jgi:hypothetical protein
MEKRPADSHRRVGVTRLEVRVPWSNTDLKEPSGSVVSSAAERLRAHTVQDGISA